MTFLALPYEINPANLVLGVALVLLTILLAIFNDKIFPSKKEDLENTPSEESSEEATQEVAPKERTLNDYTKEEAIEYLENLDGSAITLLRAIDALYLKLDENEVRRFIMKLVEIFKQELMLHTEEGEEKLLDGLILLKRFYGEVSAKWRLATDLENFFIPEILKSAIFKKIVAEQLHKAFTKDNPSTLEILENLKQEVKKLEEVKVTYPRKILDREVEGMQKGVKEFAYSLVNEKIYKDHKGRKRFLVFGELSVDQVYDQKLSLVLNDTRVLDSRKFLFQETAQDELRSFQHSLRRA